MDVSVYSDCNKGVMGMREKLIEVLDDFPVQMEWHENEELADHLIANGATIPVRCKDCKHFHRDDDRLAQHCRLFGAMMGEDDFCSCGERRTDGK